MDILNDNRVQEAIRLCQTLDEACTNAAPRLIAQKSWAKMNPNERKICVRGLVSESESEKELEARIESALGITGVWIHWEDPPTDLAGKEAQVLFRALGGLISKNGAFVSIEIDDVDY